MCGFCHYCKHGDAFCIWFIDWNYVVIEMCVLDHAKQLRKLDLGDEATVDSTAWVTALCKVFVDSCLLFCGI